MAETVGALHGSGETCRFCDPASRDYYRWAHWGLMSNEERRAWVAARMRVSRADAAGWWLR